MAKVLLFIHFFVVVVRNGIDTGFTVDKIATPHDYLTFSP